MNAQDYSRGIGVSVESHSLRKVKMKKYYVLENVSEYEGQNQIVDSQFKQYVIKSLENTGYEQKEESMANFKIVVDYGLQDTSRYVYKYGGMSAAR